MGVDFSQPALIAIDEIQLVKNLPSFIKCIYDTYGVKFIVTGSSSYYMKNQFSESLAGRKRIFEIYPLNFKEFLQFKNSNVQDYSPLNVLAEKQLSSGQVFENAIAVQLKNQGVIQYYQKRTGQEIDFIFNGTRALEVKETPTQNDKVMLQQRASAIGLTNCFLVGRHHSHAGFSDFLWGGNIF